jgi:hypothetical protein
MVTTYPPKPKFPLQAYAEGRGERISAARKAIYEEFPDALAGIDQDALRLPPIADGECWLYRYETALAKLRAAALPAVVDEDAPTPTLAPRQPLSFADRWYEHADPLLRDRLTPAAFAEIVAALPTPPRSLEEVERLEDGWILQLRSEDIEAAKIVGGACYSRGTRGELRQVEGFNQGGAAKQVKIAEELHDQYKAARPAFRRERRETVRQLKAAKAPVDLSRVIEGVVIGAGGTTRRLT